MKAIDTIYNGYRFRSRLEARWAVFFDELGWQYTYEAEGFELPSGRYLPDFYLPAENAFIEIKPSAPTEKELALAFDLFKSSGESVYIFSGDPWEALAPEYPGMHGYSADPEQSLSFLYLADYRAAAERARQARFEHGERGR